MAYQVFISFKRNALDGSGKTRDYELAADLHRTLTAAGIKTFFSEKDLSSSAFVREIYKALDEAKIIVVVGTRADHMTSEWVHSEWEFFLTAILGKRKPKGEIYTYLEGMSNNDLPPELYGRQSFLSSQKAQLVQFIKGNLGMTAPAPQQPVPKPTPAPKPQAQPAPKPTPASAAKPASSSTPKPQAQPAPKPQVQVGSIIPFGRYPQGAHGEVKPLEWRVLDVQDSKALLITDKLIDVILYNKKLESVTWETCTLRQWMNSDFISRAFNSSQQAQIATVTNQNPDNPIKGTKGGNATQDRIFALSIDEANRYFRSDEDRMAAPTAYAIKNGAWTHKDYSLATGEKTGWWWLRSPGYDSDYAAIVRSDGHISQYGLHVDYYGIAVRPALWLNL